MTQLTWTQTWACVPHWTYPNDQIDVGTSVNLCTPLTCHISLLVEEFKSQKQSHKKEHTHGGDMHMGRKTHEGHIHIEGTTKNWKIYRYDGKQLREPTPGAFEWMPYKLPLAAPGRTSPLPFRRTWLFIYSHTYPFFFLLLLFCFSTTATTTATKTPITTITTIMLHNTASLPQANYSSSIENKFANFGILLT